VQGAGGLGAAAGHAAARVMGAGRGGVLAGTPHLGGLLLPYCYAAAVYDAPTLRSDDLHF